MKNRKTAQREGNAVCLVPPNEWEVLPSGLQPKLKELSDVLRKRRRLAIAFSGGVDSTFLLAAANEVLDGEVLAVIAKSPLVPASEYEEALSLAKLLGVELCEVQGCNLDSPAFAQNPPDRCYLCKKDLMGRIVLAAKEHGFDCVAEGSNVDDMADYRPGFAAVRELGLASPLLEAGLAKQDIRDLSRWMGLPTWDKPSFACLASRFPYGDSITEEKLTQLDAAEEYLHALGVPNARVRVHGGLARIEVLDGEMPLVLERRGEIDEKLRGLGYSYVALDLRGYRRGSMNEVLSRRG